ncbi:MAG TPA: HNH endonuclease signature motif containing protein, partial [Ornithinibacter sp.]|nr:HNH endonuclease signature motif containing protein [Ornithinibacter sp.]
TSAAYRPPKSITEFVATRDGTCRMWGCARSAVRCDTDHARPWPRGATSPKNLADLCRRHHRFKQRGRWAYRIGPDGTVTWTSPTGKQRTTLTDHAVWPPPPPVVRSTDPTPAPPPARNLASAAAPPF